MCQCDSGYEPDGVECLDRDECTLGLDNCDAHATCENSDGSFTCTCDEGWEGDGVVCTAQCVPTRYTPEEIPVALYLMFDQSGSMSTELSSGNTLWAESTSGMEEFIALPPAAPQLTMGVQFFPLEGSVTCPSMCSTDPDCGVCGPCFQGFCLEGFDHIPPPLDVVVAPRIPSTPAQHSTQEIAADIPCQYTVLLEEGHLAELLFQGHLRQQYLNLFRDADIIRELIKVCWFNCRDGFWLLGQATACQDAKDNQQGDDSCDFHI